jgi:SAM-dependent methyltransferase
MLPFQDFITDKEKAKKLVEGSFVFGVTYQDWRVQREFLLKSVTSSGSVLDIGCANGFLLRCFLEWSPHKLIPYGFDVVEDLVKAARELLPEYKDNFAVLSIDQIDEIAKTGLPPKYDFIHFHIWDDWNFDKPWHWRVLHSLWERTQKCLALSFYDPNQQNVEAKVKLLLEQFQKPDGKAVSEHGSQSMIWYNKK